MTPKHKEGCTWKKFEGKSVYNEHHNGNDEELNISQEGIVYTAYYGTTLEDRVTHFNFCPICGCEL